MTEDDKRTELPKSQEEIRDLLSRLELAELRNIELAGQLRAQTVVREQVTLDWRLKVDALNKTIADQAIERDKQLSEISADLIYFESSLLRNKEKAQTALLQKDKKIREQQRQIKHQQKQIDALNYANERLLSSLHGSQDAANCEENDKRDSVSGYDSDETLCDTEQLETEDAHNSVVNGPTTNGFGGERLKNARNHSKIRESYQDVRPARHYNKRSANHVDNHVGSHLKDFTREAHVTSRSAALRRRKFSDVTNGYRTSSSEQWTNGTAPAMSEKTYHRVRFRPDVNKIQEEPNETDTYNIAREGGRLRKYSLPAYRLPLIIDDDADEEFI